LTPIAIVARTTEPNQSFVRWSLRSIDQGWEVMGSWLR
jgi:hypothetical protein